MKTIKNILEHVSVIVSCTLLLSMWDASAQVMHSNSVSVDSVWNSDSSWYDVNGILQQRTSRDCRISFLPQDTGSIAQCTVSVSLDSGRTWAPNPNPLLILVSCVDSFIHQGQKGHVTARVLGQDRPNVVFRIATMICKVPLGITSPAPGAKLVAGDTVLVSWTQSVPSPTILYDYNFGAGWQQFATVIPVDNYSEKVVLPITSYTDSFQIQVEDTTVGFDVITGYLRLRYIVITNPLAGQTLTVGSTVMITWKDTPARLSSLRIMLSTDGGKSFGDMLTGSISDLSQTSYSWVIGSEPGGTFAYPSSSCVLKIVDYVENNYYDVTGIFTVNP